ncbi:hypothetical protein BSKO_06161 [Bryopsis sp. KO-2023]|nr:hypothetical protein BSKO_06161 [Bryopsis sp. KO-2023]
MATPSDQRSRAMKMLKKGQPSAKEIDIHSRLYNPNICRFVESFEYENQTCIVMEHATRGTLHEYGQKWGCLPEHVAQTCLKGMHNGAKYMHNEGFAHLDLKPGNVLMTPRDVKLADFGHSVKILMDRQVLGFRGTPEYMAPELLSAPYKAHDPKKADVYSLGVILYAMLMGAPPRINDRIFYIGNQLQTTNIDIPDYSGNFFRPSDNGWCETRFQLTHEVKQLLSSMLDKDPEARITMESIEQHKWMKMRLPSRFSEYENRGESLMDLPRHFIY